MFKTISAGVGLAVMSGSLAFAGQAPATSPAPATPSGATQSAAPAPPSSQPDAASTTTAKKHKKHKKHHKKPAATTQTPPAAPDGAK